MWVYCTIQAHCSRDHLKLVDIHDFKYSVGTIGHPRKEAREVEMMIYDTIIIATNSIHSSINLVVALVATYAIARVALFIYVTLWQVGSLGCRRHGNSNAIAPINLCLTSLPWPSLLSLILNPSTPSFIIFALEQRMGLGPEEWWALLWGVIQVVQVILRPSRFYFSISITTGLHLHRQTGTGIRFK